MPGEDESIKSDACRGQSRRQSGFLGCTARGLRACQCETQFQTQHTLAKSIPIVDPIDLTFYGTRYFRVTVPNFEVFAAGGDLHAHACVQDTHAPPAIARTGKGFDVIIHRRVKHLTRAPQGPATPHQRPYRPPLPLERHPPYDVVMDPTQSFHRRVPLTSAVAVVQSEDPDGLASGFIYAWQTLLNLRHENLLKWTGYRRERSLNFPVRYTQRSKPSKSSSASRCAPTYPMVRRPNVHHTGSGCDLYYTGLSALPQLQG